MKQSEAQHTQFHKDEPEYKAYMARIQLRFDTLTANQSGTDKLFKVDSKELFEAYLKGFPSGERQHHNCNACRHFISRFGGIVVIDSQGDAHSPLWDETDAPDMYKPSIKAVRRAVDAARVIGVFASDELVWGQPVTGEWRHFAVKPAVALVYRPTATMSAGQYAAEKKEEFGMVGRALREYMADQVDKAVELLEANALYRQEKVIGPAKWLQRLFAARDGQSSSTKENFLWKAVATAPKGYAHVKTTMVSSLLEDIKAGLPFDDVKRKFEAKMDPTKYGHSQAAPTVGAVKAAEDLVAKLGIAPSLARRYATLEELPTLWKQQPNAVIDESTKIKKPAAKTTVFGAVKTKSSVDPVATAAALDIPAQTMTWDKFTRTVLPGAAIVQALVPASRDRFAALVTAVDPDSPPILQWDAPDERNPYSWYYESGIDAEVKRRVTRAGGQYDNVDVRASLIWNNRTDLDLHVENPHGDTICFVRKRVGEGWLDVDMNISGETDEPVENIRWLKGKAPAGHYKVMVHNYTDRSRGAGNPFAVELEVGGRVFRFDGNIGGVGYRSDTLERPMLIASFNIDARGQLQGEPVIANGSQATSKAAPGALNWGLTPGSFVPVRAFVESPNYWGDEPMTQHGHHMFAILEGCEDNSEGLGRGFFTETLRSELRPARATLEAFLKTAEIGKLVDTVPACGLGMSEGRPWELTLRVQGSGGAKLYRIDRWD